jgi:hypothetical protein
VSVDAGDTVCDHQSYASAPSPVAGSLRRFAFALDDSLRVDDAPTPSATGEVMQERLLSRCLQIH